MDQAELELKIDVWKKLALSKQMLIRAATDSLGLDPEVSMDEFKKKLNAAIEKGNSADETIEKAQKETAEAIAEMEQQVVKMQKVCKESDLARTQAIQDKESMEHTVSAAREANSNEIKKATAQISEKDRALKSIKLALADSPENVVKKLKALKKEKFDEATARKRAEDEARALKKDKQTLETDKKQQQEKLDEAVKLAEQHRALHILSESQFTNLSELVEDSTSLEAVPALDEELLELIAPTKEEKDEKVDKEAKKKTKKKKVAKK
ncbi:MAG: hypothetical protein GKR96_10605 [Gammaproteobacteria bacterium]|nr:hypothetical protein [Gammaproteobacteria bacterium]